MVIQYSKLSCSAGFTSAVLKISRCPLPSIESSAITALQYVSVITGPGWYVGIHHQGISQQWLENETLCARRLVKRTDADYSLVKCAIAIDITIMKAAYARMKYALEKDGK